MSLDLANYPLRASMSARRAVAQRLAEHLAQLEFSVPTTTTPEKFKSVTVSWARFEQSALAQEGGLPALAILSDKEEFVPTALTPQIYEDTWSGGDPLECDGSGAQLYPYGDGSGEGFVLVSDGEITVPLVLVFRATSESARDAIEKRLEEIFLEDGTLADPSVVNPSLLGAVDARPSRSGRILEVPYYYNRKVRYTSFSTTNLDQSELARTRRWLGQCEVRAEMQRCVLRRGVAFNPRVQTVTDGITEDRTSGV